MFPAREVLLQNGSLAIATLISSVQKEKTWKTIDPKLPRDGTGKHYGYHGDQPLLVKLSVPMMISMLVQALYNVVDSVFVSWVSEEALTAVSLAFSLQNMMIAVGVGTGVGVNAMLSKSPGEKNQKRANATAENGIFCRCAAFGVPGHRPYLHQALLLRPDQ